MTSDDLTGLDAVQLSRRDLLERGALGAAALGVSGGLLGAVGTGVARGAAAGAATPQQAVRPLEIVINSGGIDTSPIYAGIERGFYRRHGLDMKPQIVTTGGPGLVAALASGQAKVAPIGTAATYPAIANGIPLKIIGIVHGTSVKKFYSTNYIVAGPRAGVGRGEVAKLRGKRIGLPLGTDGEAGLLSVLAAAGVGRDDVRLVNVAPPDLAIALETGAVDAVSFVEPWPSVSLVRVPGAVRVSSSAPLYGPGIFVTTEETIRSNRALLVDFLAASAQAQQWARRNLNKGLIDVIQRTSGVAPEVSRRGINFVRFDGRISKLTLSRLAYLTIPTLISLNILTKGLDAKTAIDSTLSKEVQREVSAVLLRSSQDPSEVPALAGPPRSSASVARALQAARLR